MAQLVRGVQTIHGAGFIHRDLKPVSCFFYFLFVCFSHRIHFQENVLISEGRVKIVDFGAAKPLVEDDDHELGVRALESSVSGTTAWNVAPERGYGEAESPAADVWALGCVLFFMLTGNAPFRNLEVEESDEVVIDRVLDEDVRRFSFSFLLILFCFSFFQQVVWPEKCGVSAEGRSLVEWLLDKELADRPSLESVLEHAWFE